VAKHLTRESAETVAFEALAFIAGDDERLGRFVMETGIAPDRLAAQTRDPAFPTAIMAWLMGDEPMLLAFAAERSMSPEAVVAAAHVLAPPAGDFSG
jgi:hypothetical protein